MVTKYIIKNSFDAESYAYQLTREINSHWGFEASLLNLSQIEVSKKTYTFVVDIVYESGMMSFNINEKMGSFALNVVSEILMSAVFRRYYGNNYGQTYKRHRAKEKLESIVSSFTKKYMN